MASNDKFELYWRSNVMPLINMCTEGYSLLSKIACVSKSENDKLIDELFRTYGYKDWNAVMHIGIMADQVNLDIERGKNPKRSILSICDVFNSESYYDNVFNGVMTKETILYRKLGRELQYLLDL